MEQHALWHPCAHARADGDSHPGADTGAAGAYGSARRPAERGGPISGSSDADTIQQLQMKLYGLGLLSTDGLQAGILDQKALQVVAKFQTRMNE